MDAHWYIDALDARAGRAFASFRSGVLAKAEDLDGFQQSYYIAPPSFEPEAVSGAAIGLGGTRGTFQGGLYDEEGEVPFPSLATIVDFIRRAYLSGGGDAGPDGDGPPEPPEEGGPGGEGPFGLYRIDSEYEGLGSRSEGGPSAAEKAGELLQKLTKFDDVTAGRKRGDPGPSGLSYSSFSTGGGGSNPVTPSERLVRAASLLWLDLLTRAPTTTADAKKWRHWRLSMSALADLFEYLRLPEFILVDRHFSWRVVDRAASETDTFLKHVSNRVPIPLSDYWRHRRHWMDVVHGDRLDPVGRALLHWLGPKSDYLFWVYGYRFAQIGDIEETFSYYFHRRYFDEPVFAWSNSYARPTSPQKSVFCLNALPLPMSISRGISFGSVGRQRATLFNFMSVCCATTDEVFATQSHGIRQARFDLLFLAACLVVGESDLNRFGGGWMFSGGVSSVLKEEIEDWHNVLADRALKWLPSNLPQFAFDKGTEEMIGATRDLIYA